MTAAEKYAELEAAGLERPVCECHGAMKCWHAKQPSGGHWRCSVKRKEVNRAWRRANPYVNRLAAKRTKSWRAANPGRRSIIQAAWKAANPDLSRERERLKSRRRRGWYDEGGMATKPVQVPKELILSE